MTELMRAGHYARLEAQRIDKAIEEAVAAERERWQVEVKRLQGLFEIDGEQHASYIRGLEAKHELRHKHYCAEIERLRAELAVVRERCALRFERFVNSLSDYAEREKGYEHVAAIRKGE